MSEISQYVVDGYNWETVISIDVEGKTEAQILEELRIKGINWFNSNPDKQLKISVMMGFYKKIDQAEVPKSTENRAFLTNSPLIRTKKDIFYGFVKPTLFSHEELQEVVTNCDHVELR